MTHTPLPKTERMRRCTTRRSVWSVFARSCTWVRVERRKVGGLGGASQPHRSLPLALSGSAARSECVAQPRPERASPRSAGQRAVVALPGRPLEYEFEYAAAPGRARRPHACSAGAARGATRRGSGRQSLGWSCPRCRRAARARPESAGWPRATRVARRGRLS